MAARFGKGGSGGGAGGAGGGDTAVAALVKSINKHKNFRQLASYSVKCLQKVITPPNMGWENNMREAMDAGALEAITVVLKKHSGDEEVLAAATGCLSALATNPKYAGQLVESGAMIEMINSATANPTAESGVVETLQLMEVVSTNNPEALLKHGGVPAVKAMLESCKDHPMHYAVAMRTLEKINKVPGGSEALVSEGCVALLMEAIMRDEPTEEEEAKAAAAAAAASDGDAAERPSGQHLEAAFRTLDRMCRVPAIAEEVQKADGMRVLSAALDKHKAKSRACKIGGRVLTKLASGNVKELIHQLENATGASEKEFLSQLLSNLALEEDNAEKIVEFGGIPTLLNTFNDASATTIQGSARALARIATSDEYVDQLVAAGAVTTLVKTISDHAGDASIAAAVTPTLLKMATNEENAQAIADSGGLAVILKTLTEHPENAEFTGEALRFIENLGTLDYDMSQIAAMGGVAAILAGMRACPADSAIQLNATRSLIYLGDTEPALSSIVAAGAMPLMLKNMETGSSTKSDKPTVLATMYMLTTLAMVPSLKPELAKSGGVDVVLSTIAHYANDVVVTANARELVAEALDTTALSEVVSQIQASLTALLAKPVKSNAQALIQAVGKAGAFSIVQENAEHMVSSDGVGAIVNALGQVASAPKMAALEQILRSCSTTLMQISDSVSKNDALRTKLGTSGAVQAVIASVKSHPKLKVSVTSGVAFLESYAQIPECATLIAESGGVEACSMAMAANGSDLEVTTSAVNTLLQLGASDDGALLVAQRGGTRQIISTIEANTSTPNFAKPMESMLALLQRVAMMTEGSAVLVKQGGVDAVIDAADALGSDNSKVSQGSTRVLAKLLTKEDVHTAVARLNETAGNVIRSGRIPPVEDLRPIVSRVGHMSLVGSYAGTVVEEGGAASLVGLIGKVLDAEDPEVKGAVLPVAIAALGNLAVRADVDPALGAAAMLSRAVGERLAVRECLDCIATMGKNEDNARVMATGASLEVIVDTLKTGIRTPEIAGACFSALASLASHESTVDGVAATAATRLVQDWLDDNMDDPDGPTLAAAVKLLSSLATSKSTAAAMLSSGTVELIKSTLTKACIEGEEPAPEALGQLVSTVVSLGQSSPGALKQVSDAGLLKRVLRAISSKPEYIKNGDTMIQSIEMLTACGSDAEVASSLVDMGVDELIVAAMNANGTNQEMLVAGAKAMSALGLGAEAGLTALEDVKAGCAGLEGAAAVDPAMVQQLGEAVQRLSNLMMVEGIVTPDNANEMMSVLNDALARLADSDIASPETLAAGVASIGRLSSMCTVEEEAMSGALEMVMDVLQMNEDDDIIRETSIHCIGNMAQGATAIKVMAQQGCMAVITEAAKAAPADQALQSIVSQTLQKITKQAETSVAELAADGEDGAEALASVIEANAGDADALAACVENIIAVEGGEAALWEVLDNEDSTVEMGSEMLRVLHDKTAVGGAASIVASPKKVQGLMRSITSGLGQHTSGGAAESRQRLVAVGMVSNSLSLLSGMSLDAASSEAIVEGGGAESLIAIVSGEDDAQRAQAIRVLRTVTGASATTHRAIGADTANVKKLLGCLKANMHNEAVVADTLQVLSVLSGTIGIDKLGIDRDGMRAVQAAQSTYAGNGDVTSACSSLVAGLSSVFSDEPARQMEASLGAAVTVLAGEEASAVQELATEDGRVYYFNTTTNETVWERPAALEAVHSTMAEVARVASQQADDNIADVAPETLAAIVRTMETHAGSASLSKHAADTLRTLAINEGNCDAIARSGGVRAILAAIRKNPNDPELLTTLMTVLEKISRNDYFKEQVATDGGVELVIDCATRHVATEKLAVKCLSTMANLAFNSDDNIKRIMDGNGVKAVEAAMQAYPASPRLLENAMCALSNLMYGSNENKRVIGLTCGDEITKIINDHCADVNLFKMALRAMGNLAYFDENIEFIVCENHATVAIVKGMQTHPDDTEALQLAIEVLGNFASLEEDEDVEDTVAAMVFREGGTGEIIRVMSKPGADTGLLKSGMDALANVANDLETTEEMAETQGLVPLIVDVMRMYDWDGDLVAHAVPLLTTLSYAPGVQVELSSMDALSVLLEAMKQHGDSNHDLLLSAQVALTNLAAVPQARTTIANISGTDIILGNMQKYIKVKAYGLEAMATLTRLAGDDALSMQIAEDGMHAIMAAIKKYARDPAFLAAAFRLLGHLAFVEANLQVIVSHGGIELIIKAICEHPDDVQLLVRSIQTIDNIAMANKEHAQLVIDEGGRQVIEQIMAAYKDDDDIARHGRSAILSMSALENLSRTADLAGSAGAAGGAGGGGSMPPPPPPSSSLPPPPPADADPLLKYRNFLSAGSVLTLWTRGSPKAVHVLVSPDWNSIVWQDPKKSKKIGALDLRSITSVTPGMADGHKKRLMGKKCDPNCAFSIVGERSSVDLEVNVKPDVNKWVTALNTLLEVYRTNPGKL